MNEKVIKIDLQIDHKQQGSYFTVPFDVPQSIETIDLFYQYPRRLDCEEKLQNGMFTAAPELNIVDLGLVSPDGRQVGASGSDKSQVHVSETISSPGYRRCSIQPGRWELVVGAYKIDPAGVLVHYEITLTEKSIRLLRGDLHVHSIASDGVHTLEELALKARANGLDFVAVTDHNQPVTSGELPCIPGVTMIPGIEWTHYQGHANFLGVDAPYDEPFYTNTLAETQERFFSARERGALITVNHPFEGDSSFKFELNALPFDCLEVWNGPMRESNLKALGLWQQLLASGSRLPITGGSDYHRDTPFIFLGGPTMGVYAMSGGANDILDAVRQGHSFITFAPNGPAAAMSAGNRMMGDQVSWQETRELTFRVEGLLKGDVVRVVTAAATDAVFTAATDGALEMIYAMQEPGFARLEVLRAFLPGLPMLPALITNPIYFTA